MATFTLRIDVTDPHLLHTAFGDEPADGDRIVRDIRCQLDTLLKSGALSGGPLLRLNGRCSVAGAIAIATRLIEQYEAIATYDPKIGPNAYIVSYSRSDQHSIGDLLIYETTSNAPSLKIVLCGPPNTGKTCLREGLKQALGKLDPKPPAYIISACPDGDGSWFSETAQRDPDFAQQLKQAYKQAFTEDFAHWQTQQIGQISNCLLIFDVGGIPSNENRLIMAEATHAVILWKENGKSSLEEWRALCYELSVPIIAELESRYDDTEDQILIDQDSSPEKAVLKGSIHYLERGEMISERPLVQALAQQFIQLWHGVVPLNS